MTAPVPHYPINNFNQGILYVTGLEITYVSTTVLSIAAGQARSQFNANDIILDDVTTINSAITGAGGLDTGTIANATAYAIHIIGSSSNAAPVAGMISLSATDPTLPEEYDMFCRIGYIYTGGSADFIPSFWEGHGSERICWYDDLYAVASGASNPAFASLSVQPRVPYIGTTAILNVALTPSSPGDTVSFRPTGSSSTNGIVIVSAGSAGVAQTEVLVPVGTSSGVPSVQFMNSSGATVVISVAGYFDHLLAAVPTA